MNEEDLSRPGHRFTGPPPEWYTGFACAVHHSTIQEDFHRDRVGKTPREALERWRKWNFSTYNYDGNAGEVWLIVNGKLLWEVPVDREKV